MQASSLLCSARLLLLFITLTLCNLFVHVSSLNQLVNVEFYPHYNSKVHNTLAYDGVNDNDELILRRGERFNLGLKLSSNYNPSTQDVVLQFLYGRNPGQERGTLVNLNARKNENFARAKGSWDIDLYFTKENSLDVQIYVPANVPIGAWTLRVAVTENRDQRVYTVQKKIYIVFNPWSKDDAVYLSDESSRREYVLNDVGKMYMGTYGNREAREWLYGQFKTGVLQAILFVLDSSGLTSEQKANPIYVGSVLSALTNSHDENGVVVGKWDKPYLPYKAPWQWTGSASILLQYHQSNGNPVRYGQCWVFAGVLTTMCRGLGIPARPITNYGSAHDTNRDLKVERYFDRFGETNPSLTRDSIWNFHVWTEAWMARSDLPQGYDGWQVIDGTPQEPSNGIYRLGPVPVKAIKKGDIHVPYDAPFVYAEVNADIQDYLYDDRFGRYSELKEVADGIGRLLITKNKGYMSYGLSDAEDITTTYKFREGTREERTSYYTAAQKLGLNTYYASAFTPRKKEAKDILLYSATPSGAPLGQPFQVNIWLYNQNSKPRTVDVNVNVSSVYYTGGVANDITIRNLAVVLEPHKNASLVFDVTPDEYLGKLVGLSMLKVFTFVAVKEKKQVLNHVHNFKLDDPKLDVALEGPAVPGEPFPVNVRFTNPFDKPLNDCKMEIESRRFGPKEIEIGNIGGRILLSLTERITIPKPGLESFVINLACNQISNVLGKLDVKVGQ